MLHSIFGFTHIFGGRIHVGAGAEKTDITRLDAGQKLLQAGIAYVMQDKSVFPDMTVEENLWMGGYLLPSPAQAKERAERILQDTTGLPRAGTMQRGSCPAASAACWKFHGHSS